MNDFVKEKIKPHLLKKHLPTDFEVFRFVSGFDLEKRIKEFEYLYYQGHIYKIIETGKLSNGDSAIKVIDVNNPSNKSIRTLKYFTKGMTYFLKFNEQINESSSSKKIYIIRGIPGSGKTTLAKTLSPIVIEADDYMMNNGKYEYSKDKVIMAHNKCRRQVERHLRNGDPIIAVANTFIKREQYKPYIELAKKYGYSPILKTCNGNYENVHEVPQETVEKMKQKFEECKIIKPTAKLYESEINEILSLAGINVNESVFWRGPKIGEVDIRYYNKDEPYEKEDEMIVWKNPSPEWLKNQLFNGKDFRFCYNTGNDTLYCWYGDMGFHMDTMDTTGADGDIIGTLWVNPTDKMGSLTLWEGGDLDETAKFAAIHMKKYFDVIFPNGYDYDIQY